ncbi:MAG: FG-GAP-like repeat-containing protein, partial [Limisphaerales bacterium]
LLRRTALGVSSTYQWRSDGVDLQGKTGSTLRLTNLVAADAGHYSVVVSNTAGIVTNFVYLHVDTQFTKITTGPVVTDTGIQPMTPSWGDINGDGFLDLIIADLGRVENWSRVLEPKVPLVYLNNQDGTFRRATEADIGPLATSAVAGGMANWADYDNDGRLDFFQQAWIEPCGVFRGELDGKFSRVTADIGINQPLAGWGPWGYSWVDYDRDGFLDLYLATGGIDSKAFDQLFRNRGDGTFEKADSHYFEGTGDSQYACWADYDGDGDPDVMVGSIANRSKLFRNEGGGRFSDVSAPALPHTPGFIGAWADYDQDGDLDLLSGRLFANDGQGGFVVKTGSEAPRNGIPTWVDYDNDGCLDAFVADYDTSRRYLYRYDRDSRTFQEAKLSGLSLDPMANANFAWADYDNDGFQDLVVCSGASGVRNRLYHNNGNGNHWLLVKLIGTTSNRDAIGAKVRTRASIGGKTTWQMQEISGTPMVGERRAHFGLRNATNVTNLRIEWPSGTVQELANVAANQILTVIEPRRPVLQVAVANTGSVSGTLRGDPAKTFEVWSSDDLVTWTVLTTVTADATGAVTWSDPNPAVGTCRAYKASLKTP